MSAQRLRPGSALLHPLWLTALALLVVNDHALKGAGILPGWATGKLSDVAGMLVAPMLLASMVGARSRRSVAVTHLVVGLGFALINLSTVAARALEQVTAHTPFPWQITVDPTDLVALPFLLLSFWCFVPSVASEETPVTERVWPRGLREGLRVPAGMVGAIACMATSEPPPQTCEELGTCDAHLEGAIAFANGTASPLSLRIRPLSAAVTLDCEAVAAAPDTILSSEMFAPADAWRVDVDRAVVLRTTGTCSAYLVDGDGVPMTLLFWRQADYPDLSLSTRGSDAASPRTVWVRPGPHDGYVVDPHEVVFPEPRDEDEQQPASCLVPPPEVGVDWSLPLPAGPQLVASVASSPDGCHALELASGGTWFLCVPPEIPPPAPGEALEVRVPYGTGDYYPETEAYSDSSFELLRVRVGGRELHIGRGDHLVRRGEGHRPGIDYDAKLQLPLGCVGHHDACGSYVSALEASIYGPETEEITTLRAGSSMTLLDGATLHLVRAQDAAAVITSCTPAGASLSYLESVLVTAYEGEEAP